MRTLTPEEIAALQSNGCWADDWQTVLCAGSVDVSRIRCVQFCGRVVLGDMSGRVMVPSLGMQASALFRTTLRDVELGADFYVADTVAVAGYVVGRGFVCVGSGLVSAESGSSFGIGTRVSVVNEGGGREVALSAHLTANIAYVVAQHQWRKGIVEAYEALVAREAEQARPVIADDVRIVSCRLVRNVRIGSAASLSGVAELVDGTILSCPEQPTHVGADVVAHSFVMAEGANVHSGAKLTNVFVGECAEIGAGFVAENLLAFANCQLLCGEGVSVLAGPYTVSHHKTSLLIASAYSFYNAGSATNASNHHYRLGPIHQAVYQRGVKTGSGSYVLQPAHIGAFTMVVGHHHTHPDVAEFPFSILAERDGESHLLIAQNLKTMGLFRDSRKWPKRDKRKVKRDAITFDVLNPMTVSQMMAAIVKMESDLANQKAENILMGGVRIRKALLSRAAKIYQTAVDYYLARAYVRAEGRGRGLDSEWIDCGGLVAPAVEIRKIEDSLVSGDYRSVEELSGAFASLANRLPDLEREWAVGRACQAYDYGSRRDDLADAAHRAAEAARDIREGILSDASREWNRKLMVSYGLDGSEVDQVTDFEDLKGVMDAHPDVRDCQDFF